MWHIRPGSDWSGLGSDWPGSKGKIEPGSIFDFEPGSIFDIKPRWFKVKD